MTRPRVTVSLTEPGKHIQHAFSTQSWVQMHLLEISVGGGCSARPSNQDYICSANHQERKIQQHAEGLQTQGID